MSDIGYLKSCCVAVGSIGKSEDCRDIPYVYVGGSNNGGDLSSDGEVQNNSDLNLTNELQRGSLQNGGVQNDDLQGGNNIIITGGIHAREHISSYIVMRQIFYSLNHYGDICGDDGIYFVPMLNPDGNIICDCGVAAIQNLDLAVANQLKQILQTEDKSLYKANGRGVDLNTNFDANFGSGKNNIFTPSSQNYVGQHAFSESESRAIAEFTLKVSPKATVSYHCKGREIYYEFFQSERDKQRDRAIAEFINEKLRYKIVGGDLGSSGGYKDWCIQKLQIPSFTIEVAKDELSHPINDYLLAKDDIEANLDLPMRLLQRMKQ